MCNQRTLKGEPQEAFDDMLLAELGSSSLEFTRLTQVSGDPKFFDAVQRISDMLEKHQDLTKLPGMWPLVVDATKDGKFDVHNAFTLGSMADWTYECLPKVIFPSPQSKQSISTKSITKLTLQPSNSSG